MRYFFMSKEKRNLFVLMFFSFLLIGVCFMSMVIPTEAEGELYDNVVRFHVIANSDSDYDQELKLKLRDAVIENYAQLLSSYDDKTAAEEGINELLADIKAFSKSYIVGVGYDYNVEVTLGEEYYNRTEYASYTMPMGYYTSLRIIIGDGEGKNWWCVLYPPLCTKLAIGKTQAAESEFIEAGFSSEQYKIISESSNVKYKLKFRFMELFFGSK